MTYKEMIEIEIEAEEEKINELINNDKNIKDIKITEENTLIEIIE